MRVTDWIPDLNTRKSLLCFVYFLFLNVVAKGWFIFFQQLTRWFSGVSMLRLVRILGLIPESIALAI